MARRRRSKKWISVVILIALAVAAAVVAIVVVNNVLNGKTEHAQNISNKTESSQTEKKTEEKTEEETAKKEEIKQYDGDNPNETEALTGVISYASVIDGNLIIRVNIDQFLNTGNCNLVILKNGATLHQETVEIQGSVSTSTCNGFSVPVVNLTSGDLQLEVNLESEGKTGKMTGKVRI